MGLFLESFLLEIIYVLPILLWLFYKYHTQKYDFWKKQGIPYKEAVFPFGSLKDLALRKAHTGEAYDVAYKQFDGERFFGLIENGKPTLVIRDPELVKKILVKDFQHFVDRQPLIGSVKSGDINRNLPLLTGQEWKDMRHKLTPTFTSGKMKNMFELMEKCSEQLKEFLIANIDEDKPTDVKDVLGRFTMDIIASCAFGLDTNSLAGNSEFVSVLGGMMKLSKPPVYIQLIMMFVPKAILKLIPLRMSNTEVQEFLTKVVRDTVEFRKNNQISRNDFLDLLIKIRQNKSILDEENEDQVDHGYASKSLTGEGLSLGEMTANAFVFFIAGFETASSLMSFCLFELARHQDVQQTLHQHLREAISEHNGKITYQMLMEVPYLDQVINETLRLYGSVSILTRSCTKPYEVPESNLILEKGQRVVIPAYSFHHDPQYYPDPFEFKPERFAPENSKQRHPYVFLPFGEGPRICIGMRFGLMEAKLGLATVILGFQVYLSSKQEVPIEISRTSLVTQPENPVWLTLNRRASSY